MSDYKGHTIIEGKSRQPVIDGSSWPRVQMDAAQFQRFVVEVRKYDEASEISIAQMRYLHAVPIREFVKQMGFSEWYVKLWLKREYGKALFMSDVRIDEHRRGQIMFECENSFCRQMFFLPDRNPSGVYSCPKCGLISIRMFFMLSITELTVNQVSDWFQSMWDGYEGLWHAQIQRPDPEWRITKAKRDAKK